MIVDEAYGVIEIEIVDMDSNSVGLAFEHAELLRELLGCRDNAQCSLLSKIDCMVEVHGTTSKNRTLDMRGAEAHHLLKLERILGEDELYLHLLDAVSEIALKFFARSLGMRSLGLDGVDHGPVCILQDAIVALVDLVSKVLEQALSSLGGRVSLGASARSAVKLRT